MTNSILDAIDAAERVATPSPWFVEYDGKCSTLRYDCDASCTDEGIADCTVAIFKKYDHDDDSDLEIVAFMRNHIRDLVDIARAARNVACPTEEVDQKEWFDLQKALQKLEGK